MKRVSLVLTLIWGFVFVAKAQPSTFKNVAPIFYANCTKCHNPLGIGPMSLTTYPQIYAYKSLIRSYVSADLMPPWMPDTSYRHFYGEQVLTATEKNAIINWIDSGAMAGDTDDAAPAPIYANQYQLHGTPDLVLKMPVFVSNANASDAYDCFTFPSGLTQDRVIRAFEIVPGNSSIVHHAIIFMDTSGTVKNCTTGTCYTMPDSLVAIGAYAPGAGPAIYPGKAPLKMGLRLKAHCSILLQMHYPAGTAGQADSTQIRFFFYPVGTTGIRYVQTNLSLNFKIKKIIPNNVVTFTNIFPVSDGMPKSISLYSVFPHQHKVGVSLFNYAYLKNDTIPLVRINRWNFRWQGYYTYNKLVKVPVGFTIFSSHTYDNTKNNPANPYSPPQQIVGGPNTYNEMMCDSYQYLLYQPGDDTINIANLLNGDTLLAVNEVTVPTISTKAYPNPFDKLVHIGYTINTTSNSVSIVIYNIYGSKVKTITPHQRTYAEGYYEYAWDGRGDNGNAMPSGVYIYTITANKVSASGRLIIAR